MSEFISARLIIIYIYVCARASYKFRAEMSIAFERTDREYRLLEKSSRRRRSFIVFQYRESARIRGKNKKRFIAFFCERQTMQFFFFANILLLRELEASTNCIYGLIIEALIVVALVC